MALPRYESKAKFIPVLDHRQAPSGWATAQQAAPVDQHASDPGETRELSDPERARTILAGSRTGTLAVAIGDPPAPVGFVTSYSLLEDGVPLVLVRSGVERAGRIETGMPASFTVEQTPLTASQSSAVGGVTVLGKLVRPELGATDSLVAHHGRSQPNDVLAIQRNAARLYRMRIVTVVLTGGEGDVARLDLAQFGQAQADPLAAVAPGLASHMVGDQNDSLVVLCRAFGGQGAAKSAQLVGIDQYGMDLLARVGNDREPVRITFNHPVSSPDEVRRELATLVRGARFKLGVG